MARVRLSAAMRADLAQIDRWSVDQFGDDIAETYTRGFGEVLDLLAKHPKAGAKRPEFRKSIRSFVYRRHSVFYRFAGDEVLVVRVLHHAQDARRLLRQ